MQPLGDQQAQDAVAQELEPLVVGARACRAALSAPSPTLAWVRARSRRAGSRNTWPRRSTSAATASARAIRHQSRTWKKRLGRTLANQLTGFHSEAPGSHENRMISALPTRFSSGTRPTPADCSHAAVDRVVAVVAHHEVVAGRNLEDRGVVQVAAGTEVLGHEGLAVRQGLADLGDGARAEDVVDLSGADDDVLNRLAVDVELVVRSSGSGRPAGRSRA